jgi:hypothetical protein
MRLSDITTVGRPLAPRYPTNLAIGVLSLVVGAAAAVATLLSGADLLESAMRGVGAGFAVLLCWALGRELDPDHDLSAFVGAGLMTIALLFFDLPALMVILWLVVALRVVNRIVGLPARPLDSLAFLGLGGWLTWQGHWIVGVMTTVAFLLDGLLANPQRTHLVLSGVAFAGTVVLSILHVDIVGDGGPTVPVAISAAVMAGLFLIVIATSHDVQTQADATAERLDAGRLRAAQILALLTGLLYAWREGIAGVEALWPLWAAMVGVALVRVASLVFLQNQGKA